MLAHYCDYPNCTWERDVLTDAIWRAFFWWAW